VTGYRRTLSWIVILLATGGIIAGHRYLNRAAEEQDDTGAKILWTLQAKTLLAADALMSGTLRKELPSQDAMIGSPRMARGQALLYGLIDGDDREYGRDRAREILSLYAPDSSLPGEERLHRLTAEAVEDPSTLSEEEKNDLLQDQGWIARAALTRDLPEDDPARKAPRREAFRVLVGMFGLLGAAGLGLLAGCGLLALALITRSRGGLRPGLGVPVHNGTLYVEAFAVYIGLFFLLEILPALLGLESLILTFGGLVVLSILGVLWPRLRGLPWKDASRDLGLYEGEGWLKEIRAGLAGYVSILPIVAIGFGVTLFLITVSSRLFPASPGENPEMISHPIVVWISQGTVWIRLLVLFLASGFAPLFEETMFRGALFRDLRRRFGLILSAAIMAVVFAAIHPQGPAMIPALGSLAFGFALIREWRGSLIAPMTAHAVHNGILVCALWWILS